MTFDLDAFMVERNAARRRGCVPELVIDPPPLPPCPRLPCVACGEYVGHLNECPREGDDE